MEEEPHAPDEGFGVALGEFDIVEVLERRDGRVKFKRHIAYHPPNIGWAPESAFARQSEFLPLTSWKKEEVISYCEKWAGCYLLQVHTNGTFDLEQSPADPDQCRLQEEKTVPCKISGRVHMVRNFVRLVGTNGYDDFFSVDSAGNWCWAWGVSLYSKCLPQTEVLSHNQPLHPTTSGGLTAAVVAGERRR